MTDVPVGIRREMAYLVPPDRSVSALLPEADEFQTMPQVLATGYLVGLVEWACMQVLRPYLDWPRVQTVGIHVDLTHSAPTPPGMQVRIAVELVEVDRRRLVFEVRAFDERDQIAAGRHERYIVDTEQFEARAAAKIRRR